MGFDVFNYWVMRMKEERGGGFGYFIYLFTLNSRINYSNVTGSADFSSGGSLFWLRKGWGFG